MSSVVISGDTSGAITIAAPAVAGTYTQTLPQITGTLGTLNSGTTVATTSGTTIDFTSIPANVRRITIMFNAVSTSGTNNYFIAIGAGSISSSGYVSGATQCAAVPTTVNSTQGFIITGAVAAANTYSGAVTLSTLGSNIWVSTGNINQNTGVLNVSAGSATLGGVLDRIRLSSAGGTDTFDAGSINILYE
jgi:hypothetical protein